MTSITTWTRLDIGPRTGDVIEQHQLIIRWDDDGYTRIHEDALGPLLRQAGYELERTVGAAALRSAPVAHDNDCPGCRTCVGP